MRRQTRHLLFIDKSGTHDLTKVDPNWPVFVLVGLLVGEVYYQKTLAPHVKGLKSRYGLPVTTPLHSREVRRREPPFTFLSNPVARQAFYEDLNQLFLSSRMRLYAIIIDKARFVRRFVVPVNPYDTSLNQLLSLVCGPPSIVGPNRPKVEQIIAEARGKVEDKALQHEYQTLRRSGLSSFGSAEIQSRRPSTVCRLFPGRIDFVRKAQAVTGLELADLAAYPIGRAFVNQQWDNPSYVALAPKIQAQVSFP